MLLAPFGGSHEYLRCAVALHNEKPIFQFTGHLLDVVNNGIALALEVAAKNFILCYLYRDSIEASSCHIDDVFQANFYALVLVGLVFHRCARLFVVVVGGG